MATKSQGRVQTQVSLAKRSKMCAVLLSAVDSHQSAFRRPVVWISCGHFRALQNLSPHQKKTEQNPHPNNFPLKIREWYFRSFESWKTNLVPNDTVSQLLSMDGIGKKTWKYHSASNLRLSDMKSFCLKPLKRRSKDWERENNLSYNLWTFKWRWIVTTCAFLNKYSRKYIFIYREMIPLIIHYVVVIFIGKVYL